MAKPEPSIGAAELHDLLSWMSPAWPIGAFAHSGGLEWAVEAGDVIDRGSTETWIVDLIDHGTIRNDLILFVHGYRAAEAGNNALLIEIAELAGASASGAERRLETTAQGGAFRRIALATLGSDAIGPLDVVAADDLAYPVICATLMARRGIACEMAVTAWLHGVVANLVSAAQRLVPLGQTDAQRAIYALKPRIVAVAAAMTAMPDEPAIDAIGSASLLADIGCMLHETQYTRLFRT